MKKLIALAMMLIICIFCVACDTEGVSDVEEPVPQNIYSDDNISVDFIKISNSAVAGNFELYIKAYNKTDKNITVYLKDVTINGSVVTVGSGVPCDILVGANRTHGFFGRLDLAGVSSATEVTKITFKIWAVDESLNTIVTTTDLEIET